MFSKSQIRRYIIQQRGQLDPQECLTKARQIFHRLIQQKCWQTACHVACYLPWRGEVETQAMLQYLWQQSKHCYLPVLKAEPTDFSMCFTRYQPTSPMEKNRFGIKQPILDTRHIIAAQDLDLVLVPLVAFDKAGSRLGMGAGFYDRAFAFKKDRSKPLLIGLAYDLQQVEELPTDKWDLGLDRIVTETRLLEFTDDKLKI